MTQDENQTLMVQSQRTLLSPYGTRKELKEMADRIQRVMTTRPPGGEPRKMNNTEAMLLSAGALAHGLDPFLHEIWLLYDRDANPCLYVGPDGFAKAANKQIAKEGGGNWWVEDRPITDPEARKLLGIPDGALAWEVHLYDTPTMRTYSDTVKAMAASGAPWEAIVRAVGEKPYTCGTGWYLPSNRTVKQDEQFPPSDRAYKRAYHHALAKRFNLNFAGDSDGDLNPEFTGPLLSDGKPAGGPTIIEGTGGSGDQDTEDDGVSGGPTEPPTADGWDPTPAQAAANAQAHERVQAELAEKVRVSQAAGINALYGEPEPQNHAPRSGAGPNAADSQVLPHSDSVPASGGAAVVTVPGEKPAAAPVGRVKPAKFDMTLGKAQEAEWKKNVRALAKEFPALQVVRFGAPTGDPDMSKVMLGAAKCGFPTVTDSNYQQVVVAIAARLRGPRP